jgi:hypothetical protein
MKMKNEYAKLDFVRALLGNVESQTDVTHRIPTNVYLNHFVPDFSLQDQKEVLAELKKKRIISNYKLEDGDFRITKPSRSGIIDFLHRSQRPPAELKPKQTDGKISFDEKTCLITMGSYEPCLIPINTNQYFLCKLLFKEKFGTPITETDILDAIDFAKETKRKVYDAMRAVNERIERYFGIKKFIRWRTGRVWIDYKQS